jgi:hypothetical protein
MVGGSILAAALALGGAGCGPSRSANVPDAAALAAASADVRLRGTWRLQTFRPETPLEPMLQAFVQFQTQNLVVRFDGRRFVAESPGVHVDRTYQIHDAYGDRFKLTSFDAQGVPYDTNCTFVRDDVLEINSWTEPWRGVGTIVKTGP